MSNNFNWLYSEIVKDHFINPRNVLEENDEQIYDGKGVVGNVRCGDQMLIAINVEGDVIKECKWKTYGCASAIASTSMLSEAVIGMNLEDAYRVGPEEIVKRLDGLPEHKIHCSVLGDKALKAAIEDYYKHHGMEDKIPAVKSKVVCTCIGITDADIEEAVRQGAGTFEELQNRTKIATGCGGCRKEAEELFHQYHHLYGE